MSRRRPLSVEIEGPKFDLSATASAVAFSVRGGITQLGIDVLARCFVDGDIDVVASRLVVRDGA